MTKTFTSPLKSGHSAVEGIGTAKLVLTDGREYDLAGMAYNGNHLSEAAFGKLVKATALADFRVGQVVWVWGFNAYRRAVVTKIGRKNVTAAYVTGTAVQESRESVKYGEDRAWTVTIREASSLGLDRILLDPEADAFGPEAQATEADVEEVLEGQRQEAAEYQVSPLTGGQVDDAQLIVDQLLADAAPEEAARLEELVEPDRVVPGVKTGDLRMAEASLAAAVLDDYQEAVAVIDAPSVRGLRVVRGDVVRIHTGAALYEVLEVALERGRDNVNQVDLDLSMARLVPLDPEDARTPFWESLDMLHRHMPAARVRTFPVDAHQELGYDLVVVAGAGWDQERGDLRQPALADAPGSRVPHGLLLAAGTEDLEAYGPPVACLRIGDAIVINGRCFAVVWDGGPGEPRLEPQRWRNR